jgi:hypothetical protein
MFVKELRDAKDYTERARSLFVDATREPDSDTAMILIRLGRTFLRVAEEIESKVGSEPGNSVASAWRRELSSATVGR